LKLKLIKLDRLVAASQFVSNLIKIGQLVWVTREGTDMWTNRHMSDLRFHSDKDDDIVALDSGAV
jgi:hypothetical protein